MFARKAVLAAGALALLALCIWATDPWKNADYEKWSSRDVERILNNSPWAKSVNVPYYPYVGSDSRDADQPARTSGNSRRGGDAQVFSQEGTFILRWSTALTVRRALYREAMLHGESDGFLARRYLINDEENIQLTLVPTGQTMLPPAEPPTLLRETYLQLQPSGRKIPAINAETRREVDAQRHAGYIFYFPQKMADGALNISKDVTEIDFVTQVGAKNLEVKFRPADMVGVEGVDFY